MSQWFYSTGGRQVGPHTPTDLQNLLAQGHITPETPVWMEGMAAWQPLRQALPQLVPAAPPARKRGCQKLLIIAVLFGALLVVGLFILGVAAIPVYNGSRQQQALSSRDRDATTAGIPAGLLPPEVHGYKLLSATDLSAKFSGRIPDSISGTYFPPFSTEITDDILGTYHNKYTVYVRKFPSPEAADAAAREGLRTVQEQDGYFVPHNPEYGKDYNKNCYFRWVEGDLLFQAATDKSNEGSLRAFISSYRAATASVPR